MENRNNFHQDDLLERAVNAALHDSIPGELSPEQVAQLVDTVRQAANQPCPITLIERIKSMKASTRIAVAAAILIVLVGLTTWFVPGGGAALAFADVAEALSSVHSATWKSTSTVKMPDNKTVTYNQVGMFMAPAFERTETISEGEKSIGISDGLTGKTIALIPSTKKAIVINIKNPPPGNPTGRTFECLRKLIADAQKGKGGKVEQFGEKVVDGRKAQGFHLLMGSIDVNIWADPKTLLPVRVEQTSSVADGKVNIVMTDFQINPDLDKSLFSLDLPPGYSIQQTMQLDAGEMLKNMKRNPLAPLADALKLAAEYNNGVFPDELQGEKGLYNTILRAGEKLREKHGKDSSAVMKLVMDISMKLAGAFGFLNAMPPEVKNHMHYLGKGVKLGTPNCPIFWMKRKGDGRAMVLYADLSFKELSPEEARKLPQPKAAPKP